MPDPVADVAIAGGGLAGSAVAARLARAGRRVVVAEREAFPRDKLCGEFLSPESIDQLHALGVWPAIEAAGPALISQARFVTPRGRLIEVALPGTGLGVRRRVLDAALLDQARADGAEIRQPVTVMGIRRGEIDLRGPDGSPDTLRATTIIAAMGRRAAADPRPLPAGRPVWVGLQRHMQPSSADPIAARDVAAALRDTVEIHLFPGGYLGLSYVDGGRVNACALLTKPALQTLLRDDRNPATDPSPAWSAVVAALRGRPGEDRLRGLEPAEDGAIRTVSGVPFARRPAAEHGVLYVGDAAGVVAPMVGDGQAIALDSADRLATILLAQPEPYQASEALGRSWRRAFRREFRSRLWLARTLQAILIRPRGAEAAAMLLAALPDVGPYLVRATRGSGTPPTDRRF